MLKLDCPAVLGKRFGYGPARARIRKNKNTTSLKKVKNKMGGGDIFASRTKQGNVPKILFIVLEYIVYEP